ncbi:MAG: M12 family metallo-peptidase [Verrucomicrobia bacterium]|nr:M12 family metallo-peptidase [Verrucomicrobiota bacterium]
MNFNLSRFWSVLLAAVGFTVIPASAQQQSSPDLLWRKLAARPANVAPAQFWVTPQDFLAVTLDHTAMRAALALAPLESATAAKSATATASEITLPLPDGTFQRFTVVESPVMAPELAALFPEIKTYFAQGVDDPAATARLDLTPAGFHAQILSPNGAVYIDPHLRDASVYAVYAKKDYLKSVQDFRCFTKGAGKTALSAGAGTQLTANRSGTNLRTYRLACAADGEYTAFQGGTVALGMAGIVSAVNRVTGVYETELAIRLVLVANNQLLVYTDKATDPYTDADGTAMLDQNQTTVDSVIGNANYDIGHVFSTGGGGIAGLGVVCVTGSKANGVTGNLSPTGDSFWIDYVAHEMGHQFGGDHTFNSSASNCGGGNRNAATAYEPGSGSTIMAYAGICSPDDLQLHSDPYFHSVSFDEIIAYTTTGSGNNCPVTTATGNTVPTVSAGANHTIPSGTPFILTASGSDANGDTLTYCWEERDLGVSTTLTAADNGSSPIFRSFNPTTNNWRMFPQLADVLANTATPGEQLPTTTRTMNFRVTARDNRAGGGGVNTADMQVTVTSAGGAFAITSQNTSNTLAGATTVTWNVAGTTNAPVSCANVKISLSTDGGATFPTVLLASTPNDGSETVTLPNLTTHAARLKVEAIGNIFFDINNANFSIIPNIPTPIVTLSSATLAAETCTPTNGVIDSGEAVTMNFSLPNVGTAPTTNLVVTLLATNGVALPGAAQTYGALATNGPVVTRPFTFTALGACGSNITATFHLQDGATDLGYIYQTLPLGQTATLWSQNFDGVTAPALPAGWTTTTTAGGGQSVWTTVTTQRDTLPNAAFSPDPATVGSNELVTAAIVLPAGSSQLTFRHRYELESDSSGYYDGGVLEIKIGAGAWTDIVTAGGSFQSNGYNATLSSSFSSPFSGRSAWSGTNSTFTTVVVNLPPAASGQTVQFRWRCASDSSVSRAGWWVDSIAVNGYACCVGVPTLAATTFGSNQFHFTLNGSMGSSYIVQYSTNLNSGNWFPLQTGAAPLLFIESNANTKPQRFYRGKIAP